MAIGNIGNDVIQTFEATRAAFERVIIEVYSLYLESMSFRASPALSMACVVFHFLRGLPLITNAFMM